MKKLKIFLATLVAVLSFGLVACSGNSDLYKVTFMDGTSVVFELNKGKGEYLDSLPNAPAKEGYVFDGYYVNDVKIEDARFNFTGSTKVEVRFVAE